ncbi:hypothetical protein [Mycetocola zhujimingii]|uniref:Uncharacterized protein n=1 Tax=Mycetocola zhujimingii TaxID=2079792 RepID=A0A2U1TED0_9MICO|nr:hypothetical protein [Mycetocola zhujimingii]PWC07268.1 hypothetical protein DF223_06445 [Mycetocola zhujimingii]
MTDAQNTPKTGPNTENTEGTANTATSNDPLTDFSIPQDADIVADDAAGDPESHDSGSGSVENNAAGDDAVTDEPNDQADRIAENPAVDAATPAEAEELTPEPGA